MKHTSILSWPIMASFVILSFCSAPTADAQTVLEYQKGRIAKGANAITLNDAVALSKEVPEANALFIKAKNQSNGGTFFAVVSGGLIGWPLGTALGGGDPEWPLLGIGVALLIPTFTLANSAKDNAIQAIDIYNREVHGLEPKDGTAWKLKPTNDGYGLVFFF